MVLRKGEYTSSEDDDIDRAASATGATEEGATGCIDEEVAVATAAANAVAAAVATAATLPPDEGSPSPPDTTPPPGPSAVQAEGPLPPPRPASNLLTARLAQLNRERDVLREHLHPINRPLLDRWASIQRSRDYLVRANFCQTSNDIMLAEVRRLRRVVTQARQLLVCPSYAMSMLRSSLDQVLNNVPSVVRHLTSDNPHSDFEKESPPPKRRPILTYGPPDPRWTSYLRNNHPLFNTSVSMYQNIPELDYYGLGPPPEEEEEEEEEEQEKGEGKEEGERKEEEEKKEEGRTVDTRQVCSSPRDDAPIIPGEEVLEPVDQPRVGSPTTVIPWDLSRLLGTSTVTRSSEELEVFASRRRLERRRVRSDEHRERHASPESLRPGETIVGRSLDTTPVVVVVAGQGIPKKWVSPSLLEDHREPLSSSSPANDTPIDVTGSLSGSLASSALVGDTLLNGGAPCTDSHDVGPPVGIELPPLPLPELPSPVREQQQQRQQQGTCSSSSTSSLAHPGPSAPLGNSSTAARTRPITDTADDRHFSYSQSDFPYRETYPSSSYGSPHLIFHFTDEEELGIRHGPYMLTPLDDPPSSTTTTTTTTTTSGTDQSRDGEEPSAPRRTRCRKKKPSKSVSESKKACAGATNSTTTDPATSTTGTGASATDIGTSTTGTPSSATDTRTEDDDETAAVSNEDELETSITVLSDPDSEEE